MLYKERLHADILVLIDDSWLYIVRIHFVTCRVRAFQSCCAHLNVFFKGLENVRGHFLRAFRSVQPQRFCPLGYPGSENQVRQTKSVVAVKVREECNVKFRWPEGGNAAHEG